MVNLRAFDLDRDVEAFARLYSMVMPVPITPERVREGWQRREKENCQTIVAVNDAGEIAGMCALSRRAWMEPGRFRTVLVVDPAFRGRGIGTALLDQGLRFARDHEGGRLVSWVRDNDPDALAFFRHRGFGIESQSFESELDADAFDETPFTPIIEKLRAEGFAFFSLEKPAADPAPVEESALRRLHELHALLDKDVPGTQQPFPPFEEYQKSVIGNSSWRPEGQILVTSDGRWVGMTALSFFPDSGFGYNMFTGVLPEYRGRQLALALKVLAVRCARRAGLHKVRTSNDSSNAPMIAVNRKLGYRPEPGLYIIVNASRETTSSAG
jgi:RimJ/RimL family protein N-acetyltransferase